MGNINNKDIEQQAKVIGEIFTNPDFKNTEEKSENIGEIYGNSSFLGNNQGNIEQNEFGFGGIQQDNFEKTGLSGKNEIKEDAGSIGAAIPMNNGYVGGFVGSLGKKINQNSNNYVGGLVEEQPQIQGGIQNLGLEDGYTEERANNLPTKVGFFGKIRAIVTGRTKVQLEISEKEEKVLTEVHDFLFQNMSIKGFLNILKIGNNKNK